MIICFQSEILICLSSNASMISTGVTSSTTTASPTTTPLTTACDWTTTDTWACCTALQPCDLGGGDCDNDGECAGSLVCGTDNCGGIFESLADCCIYPTSK